MGFNCFFFFFFFFFLFFFFFTFAQDFSDVVWHPWISIAGQLIVSVSPRFFIHGGYHIYLFIIIFIHFNFPFKIISAHMVWANQWVGRKRENFEKKKPATPASRNWFVSRVPRVGFEPSSDTAVRLSNG